MKKEDFKNCVIVNIKNLKQNFEIQKNLISLGIKWNDCYHTIDGIRYFKYMKDDFDNSFLMVRHNYNEEQGYRFDRILSSNNIGSEFTIIEADDLFHCIENLDLNNIINNLT